MPEGLREGSDGRAISGRDPEGEGRVIEGLDPEGEGRAIEGLDVEGEGRVIEGLDVEGDGREIEGLEVEGEGRAIEGLEAEGEGREIEGLDPDGDGREIEGLDDDGDGLEIEGLDEGEGLDMEGRPEDPPRRESSRLCACDASGSATTQATSRATAPEPQLRGKEEIFITNNQTPLSTPLFKFTDILRQEWAADPRAYLHS